VALSGGTPSILGSALPPFNEGPSVRFSPDGTRILFLTEYSIATRTGNLRLGNLDGSGTRVVSTGARFSDSAFTPDSTRVIYSFLDSMGVEALATALVAGGAPSTFGTRVMYSSPPFRLSPDGSSIAFITDYSSGLGSTIRVHRIGGPTTLIETGVFWLRYAFSPDGTRILYGGDPTTGDSRLRITSVSGGPPLMLASSSSPGGRAFGFAPDGASVWYAVSSGGPQTLLLSSAAGGPAVTLGSGMHPGRVVEPVFSPDRLRMAFLNNNLTGNGTLRIASLPGGSTIDLGTGVVFVGQFSPDSSRIVYLSDYDGTVGTLRSAPSTGGADTILGRNVFPRFSASGDRTRLAFVADVVGTAGQLRTSTFDGRTIVPLADGVDVNSFAFSPDSSWVLFRTNVAASRGLLQVAPSAGGASITLNRDVERAFWVGNGRLFSVRTGTPAPTLFQNGIYTSPIP